MKGMVKILAYGLGMGLFSAGLLAACAEQGEEPVVFAEAPAAREPDAVGLSHPLVVVQYTTGMDRTEYTLAQCSLAENADIEAARRECMMKLRARYLSGPGVRSSQIVWSTIESNDEQDTVLEARVSMTRH